MNERARMSFVERALLNVYGLIARRLDLHSGLLGSIYQHAYFAYKNIVDRVLVRAAREIATPGTLVLDVGANIGFFTRALVRQRDVELIAFEPDARNFAQLGRALKAEIAAARVHAYCLALSDKSGTARFYLSDLAPTDHKLIDTRSSTAVDVQTARLDDFLATHAEYRGRRISLIKIDVQGAELMVLRGMTQTLRQHDYPPILVEYAPHDLAAASVEPEDFFRAFAELGYQPHAIPDGVRLDPQSLIAGTRTYTNLLMRLPGRE